MREKSMKKLTDLNKNDELHSAELLLLVGKMLQSRNTTKKAKINMERIPQRIQDF